MKIENTTDLVVIFKDLILNLNTYAETQKVDISFRSNVKSVIINNDTYDAKPSFFKFIKKIIEFTPETFKIDISLNVLYTSNKNNICIQIENTGSDLSRVREIVSILNFECNVLKIENGTIFSINIPAKNESITSNTIKNKNQLGYTPYYLEINKRLNDYFKEIKNLELIAEKKGKQEGAFLRKINKIISLKIDDNNFKVNAMANAMALSRSQLFRKMIQLTRMSPSKYLLFYRLQIAKHLIETNNKELNISEIGYKVGFISKSHFTRSFQKQFGILPSEHKKNMQH